MAHQIHARSLWMKVYMAYKGSSREERPLDECGSSSEIVLCNIDLGFLDHLPDHLLICATSFNENGKTDEQ
jgi:hypothetical protein